MILPKREGGRHLACSSSSIYPPLGFEISLLVSHLDSSNYFMAAYPQPPCVRMNFSPGDIMMNGMRYGCEVRTTATQAFKNSNANQLVTKVTIESG
jgi:hypothetical protein